MNVPGKIWFEGHERFFMRFSYEIGEERAPRDTDGAMDIHDYRLWLRGIVHENRKLDPEMAKVLNDSFWKLFDDD